MSCGAGFKRRSESGRIPVDDKLPKAFMRCDFRETVDDVDQHLLGLKEIANQGIASALNCQIAQR